MAMVDKAIIRLFLYSSVLFMHSQLFLLFLLHMLDAVSVSSFWNRINNALILFWMNKILSLAYYYLDLAYTTSV